MVAMMVVVRVSTEPKIERDMAPGSFDHQALIRTKIRITKS